MSDTRAKGYFEEAKDKTSEAAHNFKEAAKEKYDSITGKTPEDKASKDFKKAADNCATECTNARENAADKMRDAAKRMEGSH